MASVSLLTSQGASVVLKQSSGPTIVTELTTLTVVLADAGIQGPRGFTGTMAYDQVANVLQGQTLFNLLETPVDPAKVRMIVNGTSYAAPLIAVAGQQVTWSEPFTLDETDTVEFQYPVQETP